MRLGLVVALLVAGHGHGTATPASVRKGFGVGGGGGSPRRSEGAPPAYSASCAVSFFALK